MRESNNRMRVSPYPLRSNRTQNHQREVADPSKWEEVRCVVCMEAPHNAVLMKCASFFDNCRPYMCDTNSLHSNCFKKYRKTDMMQRSTPRVLRCPLCRGEVFETTKVTRFGRTLMNAKPRPCYVDNCQFLGTFRQLDKHMKYEHHGRTLNVDQQSERSWERMMRDNEYNDLLSAIQNTHES